MTTCSSNDDKNRKSIELQLTVTGPTEATTILADGGTKIRMQNAEVGCRIVLRYEFTVINAPFS